MLSVNIRVVVFSSIGINWIFKNSNFQHFLYLDASRSFRLPLQST